MRKVLVLLIAIALAWLGWSRYRGRGGTIVYVGLPEAQGLEAGDRATLADVTVGRVERVTVAGGRALVEVRLRPEHAASVPSASTFRVERRGWLGRERRLRIEVIDPGSPPLADGARVEGSGSAVDSALQRASYRARALLARASQSEWARRAGARVEETTRALREVDWEALGGEAEERARRAADELGQLASKTGDEAKRAWAELEPELRDVGRRLEEAGKSEEAARLRRRLEQIWGGEALTPEATPAPVPAGPEATPAGGG